MLTPTRISSIKPPLSGQQEHLDHQVTGLRLRVGVTGKKTWILRARAGAKVINRKLGVFPQMGLVAARAAAEKTLEAIARGGSTAALDLTFGHVAEAWVEAKRADNRRNMSIELQRRRLELHVLPKWRNRKAIEIRRADLRLLLDSIEGDVLPNRILALVRTVFRFALSRDWIEFSPAEGFSRPKQEVPRDRFLAMTEVKKLWNAAILIGYPFGQLVQTLLLSGQRRTEVATMKWDNLDLAVGTWELKAAETKSRRAHLVPLSPSLVALLKSLPRFEGPYVFTTDSGHTHLSGFTKSKARLDKFMVGLGNSFEAWTLHDLRRTASSHMARLGVTREVRARVLNHAAVGVTDRHYTPYDYFAEKRAALNLWSQEVMRIVEGSEPAGRNETMAPAEIL